MRVALCSLLVACSESPPEEPGCGDGVIAFPEMCDDGNTDDNDGCAASCRLETPLTVAWLFYPSVKGAPRTSGCPDGVATVELVSSADATETYPCDVYAGMITVDIDDRILARLRSPTGEMLAESMIFNAHRSRITAEFYEDGGFVLADWRFGSGQSMPCTQTLVFTVEPSGSGTPVTQSLPCPAQFVDVLAGEWSMPLVAGAYDVSFDSQFGTRRTNVTIGTNNAITRITLVAP
jgi:cysteine-rich repeat protein